MATAVDELMLTSPASLARPLAITVNACVPSPTARLMNSLNCTARTVGSAGTGHGFPAVSCRSEPKAELLTSVMPAGSDAQEILYAPPTIAAFQVEILYSLANI